MAEWQEPVYDRTESDVAYARQQIEQRKNDVELKGCFNVGDITRIENNTRYLADKLFELCYTQNTQTVHLWTMGSIPYQSHISRIINNVDKLWKAYYKPDKSVDLPSTLLRYENINAIERNHFLLKEMIDNMISMFRECGTFECGEEY